MIKPKAASGDFPALKDISIAKNYLNDEELKILNNIVSGYFDIDPPEQREYDHQREQEKDLSAERYQSTNLTFADGFFVRFYGFLCS